MEHNKSNLIEWIVVENESGQKLQAYLSDRLNHSVSLKQIKRAIENNACNVNGKRERFASRRLCTGDVVIFFLPQLLIEKKNANCMFSKNNVLFEDSEILAYNKPFGISSDASGLFAILLKIYPQLVMVHRLDKETSGVILFAKSKKSEMTLINAFREKKIKKEYLAIIDGIPKTPEGIIDLSIGKVCELKGQSLWGPLSIKKGGANALTLWKVLERKGNAALLKCSPITGKTHQIRVHLQSIGHPILGDKLYGQSFLCKYHASRHFLHAFTLSFPHPVTGKEIVVKAPIPEDFSRAIKDLFGVENEGFNC